MNKINFNWITIQNFFSVGAEVRLDFNEHPGMNYVYGYNQDLGVKNGSGKSSIFIDALLFSLFNKTGKKVNKGNIPHRLVKKDCKVCLNLTVGTDTYTIENCIFPTKVTLYRGDEDITKSTIKETYEFIEKEIIKSSFTVFRNSLVLSVNGSQNIFEMTKWEKRHFVEQMMNFSHIGKMYSMVKEDLNALDKELTLRRQKTISLETNIETYRQKSDDFETNKQHTLDKMAEDIRVLENELLNLDTDVTRLHKAREQLNDMLQLNEDELVEKKKDCDEVMYVITSTQADIKSADNIRSRHSKVLDVLCDCCSTNVDNILGLDKLEKSIATKKAKICKVKDKFENTKEALSKLKEQKKALTDKITKLEKMIAKVEANVSLGNRIRANISDKKGILLEERIKASPFEDLLKNSQTELDDITKEVEEMVEKRKYLDFMVYTFSEDGVKKHLILDFINILNSRIRKYLEEMGCEYTAIFDGNFDCEFLTVTGPCEYTNFSAGERVRIDSACMFAFRDLLFGQGTLQSNLLVCDEILDTGLDEYAINSVIKILKEVALNQNVFLISHRECVSPDDFNQVITVLKQNGYTTLTDEIVEE
jgi:DNA repair exonuclease SbcCD ATPase subunit